jgi:hypothetical protein
VVACYRGVGGEWRRWERQLWGGGGGVHTRRTTLWKAMAGCALLAAGWVGGSWMIASRDSVDLGELGRRSVDWIAPTQSIDVERAMPVRLVPRQRSTPSMAMAPWPKA